MKRFVISICVGAALAALSAPAASFGLPGGDYLGQVKGQPVTSVGFSVERPASGPKRVTGFTVAGIPYECSDAPPGATAGWAFKPGVRVKARRFEGSGDWIGLPFDPVGTVSGRLRPGGVATGELKLRGELAGPGTHCRTGLLEWRATKNRL